MTIEKQKKTNMNTNSKTRSKMKEPALKPGLATAFATTMMSLYNNGKCANSRKQLPDYVSEQLQVIHIRSKNRNRLLPEGFLPECSGSTMPLLICQSKIPRKYSFFFPVAAANTFTGHWYCPVKRTFQITDIR